MWGILDSYLATCTYCGLCMQNTSCGGINSWESKGIYILPELPQVKDTTDFKTLTNYKNFPMKREN